MTDASLAVRLKVLAQQAAVSSDASLREEVERLTLTESELTFSPKCALEQSRLSELDKDPEAALRWLRLGFIFLAYRRWEDQRVRGEYAADFTGRFHTSNDPERALNASRMALSLWKKHHWEDTAKLACACRCAGEVECARDRYEQSKAWLHQALEFVDYHPRTLPFAKVCSRLGDTFWNEADRVHEAAQKELTEEVKQAKLAEARQLWSEAESWLHKSRKVQEWLEPDSLDLATTCCELGKLSTWLGSREDAYRWFSTEREILEGIVPNSVRLAISFYHCFTWSCDGGKTWQYFERFWKIIRLEALRRGEGGSSAFLSELQPEISAVLRYTAGGVFSRLALTILEDVKALSFDSELAKVCALIEPRVLRARRRVERAESSYDSAQLAVLASTPLKRKESSDFLLSVAEELSTEVEALTVAQRGGLPLPNFLSYPFLKDIPTDTLFIHFNLELGLILAVLRGDILKFNFNPAVVGRLGLNLLPSAFDRHDIPAPPKERVLDLSRKLSASLIPYLLEGYLTSVKRVVVCPDGWLWRLPFSMLTSALFPEDRPYWGQNLLLSHVPTLTNLILSSHLATVKASHGPAFIAGINDFGHPDGETTSRRGRFSVQRPGQLMNLAFAAREAKEVARIHKAKPIIDDEFDLGQMASRIEEAVLISWGSHGMEGSTAKQNGIVAHPFDAKNPAPCITAEWLAERKLAAQIIFNNACVVGRGEAQPGAGLLGLSAAMQRATVPAIIAPLTPVGDYEAAMLSTRFHDELKKGLPADEAWRNTCALTPLEPQHWFPYVLYGAGEATYRGPS